MAAVDVRVAPARAELIAAARERLEVLETAGPVALFGAAAHRAAGDLEVQRIDVEDVTAVGESAVALMVQRGRDPDGTWHERRLSAVFSGDAEPELYSTWVGGLDAASRG